MTVLNEAEALFLGNHAVEAVYLGEELVWPPAVPDPYQAVVLADQPEGFWPLDEQSGLTFRDLVGRHPGTLVAGGSSVLGDTGPEGRRSLRFVQAGATYPRVEVPDSADFNLTDSLTVEAWICQQTRGTENRVVTKLPAPQQFNIGSAGNLRFTAGDASGTVSILTVGAPTEPDDTTWVHFVGVCCYDPNDPNRQYIRMYRDGAYAFAAAMTRAPVNTGGVLYIGANTNEWMRGRVALAAYYKRDLSLDQVRRHYWTMRPSPYAEAVLADGPVVYYRLDEQGTALMSQTLIPASQLTAPVTRQQPSILPSGEGASTSFDGGYGTGATGVQAGIDPLAVERRWPVTREAWVRLDSLPANPRNGVIGIGGGVAAATVLGITPDGLVEVQSTPNTDLPMVRSTVALQLGVAYHIAMTVTDGSTASVYINGLDKSGPVTTRAPAAGVLRNIEIARSGVAGTNLVGRVQEVASYNAVLTPEQILAHYRIGAFANDAYFMAVLADEPTGFWPLDDQQGSTARDLTGQRPGTYAGNIALGQDGPLGRLAAGFDGLAVTRVTVPHDDAFNADVFTLEAWVYATPTNYFTLMGKTGLTGQANYPRPIDWRLYANGGQGLVLAQASGLAVWGPLQAPANAAGVGHWAHLVMVVGDVGAGNIRAYLNGVQVYSTARQSAGQAATAPLTIGVRADNNAPLNGRMALVAHYDHALSVEQIAAHYAAAQPE